MCILSFHAWKAPEAVFQDWDNAWHVGLIRSFLDARIIRL